MVARRSAAFDAFACPNCDALYQLVKGEAGPETLDRALMCRACGGPLPGRKEISCSSTFSENRTPRSTPGLADHPAAN